MVSETLAGEKSGITLERSVPWGIWSEFVLQTPSKNTTRGRAGMNDAL